MGAGRGEYEDPAGQDVVVATEMVEELVELDDGQLLKDGSSDQLYAGSPFVSPRSCDGAHREG